MTPTGPRSQQQQGGGAGSLSGFTQDSDAKGNRCTTGLFGTAVPIFEGSRERGNLWTGPRDSFKECDLFQP